MDKDGRRAAIFSLRNHAYLVTLVAVKLESIKYANAGFRHGICCELERLNRSRLILD